MTAIDMPHRSKAKLLASLTNPVQRMFRRFRLGACLLAGAVLLMPPAGATDRASQRSQFRIALAAAGRTPETACDARTPRRRTGTRDLRTPQGTGRTWSGDAAQSSASVRPSPGTRTPEAISASGFSTNA